MKSIMKTLITKLTYLFFTSLIILSCNNITDGPSDHTLIKKGEGMLKVDGGNIWYKVTGDGNGTPLVLLHGGPGYSSFYLKPFEELGNTRQVIRYDQLGSGKSDVIKDSSLFTINHYVEELESLRNHLKINKWNILGHSWGTIMAYEYYRKYPDRVSSLIFGSPCLDLTAWEKSTNLLLKTLPDSLQNAVILADSLGIYDDPLYEEAINMFYGKYLFGENPVETDLDSILSTANMSIYNYMWGPSEFNITGTLKDYNVTEALNEINVPTLFTVGEFDEIIPSMVQEMAAQVKNSEIEIFKGSCHLTTWGARDQSIKVVGDFLNSVDKK